LIERSGGIASGRTLTSVSGGSAPISDIADANSEVDLRLHPISLALRYLKGQQSVRGRAFFASEEAAVDCLRRFTGQDFGTDAVRWGEWLRRNRSVYHRVAAGSFKVPADRIVGIDHVQITVPPDEVAVARAFYCALLGIPEIEKPDRLKGRDGFWLQVGDRQVHVGIERGIDRLATKAHVAYAVVGLDDWRARLTAAGVEVIDGVAIPGYDRFEFRDPFGNRIEFIQASRSDP
jgi:catechol 2,3-dioxygenase-like lactoylglutathione lyase family enzyme